MVPQEEQVYLQSPVFAPEPLSPGVKHALFAKLFPQNDCQIPKPAYEANDLGSFFTYVRQECHEAFRHQNAIQTFADLILLVKTIRDNPATPLKDLRVLVARAEERLALNVEKLSTSIELVVRLWLLVSVRIAAPLHRYDADLSLPWAETESLLDVLGRYLTQPAYRGTATTAPFSPHLNVIDMKNIANFQIIWTNNLAEHLLLKDSCLYIFHQVAALKLVDSQLLPRSFVDETLSTVSLLVPQRSLSCNNWLRAEIKQSGLDRNVWYRRTADRQVRAYIFWNERLSSLAETFSNRKPSNLIQWWYDRRDMGQWWGFWLVVVGLFLTVLFGLIQSITGLLQVVQ